MQSQARGASAPDQLSVMDVGEAITPDGGAFHLT